MTDPDQKEPCSLCHLPPPQYWCWIHKPDECPLGMPKKTES